VTASERLVVIGGDAAGMSAASTAKKLRGDALDVVALERGDWTSYSACGIPYWVAGDIGSVHDLVARSAHEHRDMGIGVRLRTEAVEIDLDSGHVQTSAGERIGFDQLMIATGAEPIRPDLPGIDAEGILGIQTLGDGERFLAQLTGRRKPRSAVVVGGGYIGVEMAEACVRRGLRTTLVDMAVQPMRSLDPELGAQVADAMRGMGIDVRTQVGVHEFLADDSGAVRAVVTDSGELPADVVVLALGVRPRSEVARQAGLRVGISGGLRTSADMSCDGHVGIWAAGDVVESWDRLRQKWVHVPLGTHANKQGRIAGLGIAGERARFQGVLGTAVTKVCDLEIARTGLSEADAAAEGIEVVAATIETTTRAGYYPGATTMTVKMVADRRTRRMLGAQIVGREGAAHRIDTCAMALWNPTTVDELVLTDLAYAPPFSSVWDPVQVAARAVAAALD
jgi:NADPH-dependent 2,4-dienoyl-CoA reductase/sulfur reductase-like enzyme